MGSSFTTWLTYHHFLMINYKDMVSSSRHIMQFMSTDGSIDDTASICTLFSHTGIYIMAIGLLIPAGLGIFCCYFFWLWPARLACQPLWSGSMWHTIVDDDVEAAPIYRCDGKAGQPIIRPHENHDLCMKQETYMDRESTEATNTVKSSSCIQIIR